MKKTPLRKASKKYAKELRTYYSLKKYILSQRPYCEYPTNGALPSCINPATEIHHIRGRGKYLNNVIYWLAICHEHHRYLHDHAREARAKGLIQ